MGSQEYQYVKNSRQNLKRRLLYVMGEKCCICGYNKCTSALEFHHLKPEEKDFSIASNTNLAYEKCAEEIKKCILVCANCHREIHEKLIDVSQYSCFDENKHLEILEELKQLKGSTYHYCKNCGKIIDRKSERCPECNSLNQRIVERPSREILKEKIRNLPFTQIAKEYGVTDNAIRKWCDAENLPRKKQDINFYSDEDWNRI